MPRRYFRGSSNHIADACAAAPQPDSNAHPVDSDVTVAAPNMPSGASSSYAWVWADSSYMRELAQRCTRAARDCPHLPTSHELEAIGVELMLKAAELDELSQTSGPKNAPSKAASGPKVPKK